MNRVEIANRIGNNYYDPHIETGEWSYVKDAGTKGNLVKALGYTPEHFKLDMRFVDGEYVVLVETKVNFVDSDAKQLREYLLEEKALYPNHKIICILANTNNDKIRVWKSEIDDAHILDDETAIDTMEHYKSLFNVTTQNNREKVLKNTYDLNETLHKKDIDERLRSQFVGTALLYIKKVVKDLGIVSINMDTRVELKNY
jgi:N-6 DNA methylase